MTVDVFNGPAGYYGVRSRLNPDDSYTQLVGIDDANLDAFGRLRVSDPQTLFESGFAYDLQPQFFEAATASGGAVAHDANKRSAILSVDTTSGATAALQTRQYFPYEKGKSQLVKVTFSLGDAVTNVRRRVGYFDAANGFYLEQTSEGLRLVRRTSTTGELVNDTVDQASWNIDPLNGLGPSGLTLDPSKAQILVIDGQWLGVGRVRIGFNIDGLTYYVHEFLHANRATVAPYTQTFALPVRWEITATAASAGATFQAICCDVESEGGIDSPAGMVFSAANAAAVNTSTTRAAVLSIRPAAEYPASSGVTNRQTILPISWDLAAITETVLVEVFYNSTLTGGTWTRANDLSGVEVGVGQTISALGVRTAAFFVAAGSGPKVSAAGATEPASQYPLTVDIAGANPRAMTITATTLTATGTAWAAATWKEIR